MEVPMADIGAVDALNARSTPTKPSSFSDLTSEQFVKIMFTELTNQDPLEPSDSQAMLDQISSLRSIESDMQLGTRLDQMVDRSDFSAASSMIGRIISGITIDAEQTIDQVFSVSQTEEGPILNLLGGQRVRLADVIEVADPLPEEPTDD
jgi:flagellar basal-body rod modification protein FlgD